jgi:hypothetical protein
MKPEDIEKAKEEYFKEIDNISMQEYDELCLTDHINNFCKLLKSKL